MLSTKNRERNSPAGSGSCAPCQLLWPSCISQISYFPKQQQSARRMAGRRARRLPAPAGRQLRDRPLLLPHTLTQHWQPWAGAGALPAQTLPARGLGGQTAQVWSLPPQPLPWPCVYPSRGRAPGSHGPRRGAAPTARAAPASRPGSEVAGR